MHWQNVRIALQMTLNVYRARVFGDERDWKPSRLRHGEGMLLRLCGVDAQHEMTWSEYARAFVWFSGVGVLLLYALLRLQEFLPLHANAAALTTLLLLDLAANTAISFATTTTWQAYAGETTTYASQLIGPAAQNFLAGAAGLAIGIRWCHWMVQRDV